MRSGEKRRTGAETMNGETMTGAVATILTAKRTKESLLSPRSYSES